MLNRHVLLSQSTAREDIGENVSAKGGPKRGYRTPQVFQVGVEMQTGR